MFTEILEYIGGYILKKTAQKYAEAEHTIKVLRMDQPEGEFAKKRQKYQIDFTIKYQNFRNILPAFTCSTIVKPAKQAKEIDFKKLILDVATNWRFQNFVDFVESESDDSDDIILDVCHYMMTLLLKILSHNYAKYRLQQIQKKSTHNSKGLRGDLKTHTC